MQPLQFQQPSTQPDLIKRSFTLTGLGEPSASYAVLTTTHTDALEQPWDVAFPTIHMHMVGHSRIIFIGILTCSSFCASAILRFIIPKGMDKTLIQGSQSNQISCAFFFFFKSVVAKKSTFKNRKK